MHHEVIIIGSGPAGLTAAIYTGRANLKPLVFLGTEPGGQLMGTTEVENFPGFPEGIMGPELMDNFMKQAERFDAELKLDTITSVDFSQKPFKVFVKDTEYTADSIIIATGASVRWLGLPSETRLRGKGVSSCATCDGAFFKNKEVAVIGGGDSAMEEALVLTKFAKKVHVIHRRDEFRASKIMSDRVKNHKKIEIIWNSEVNDVLGENFVEGLTLFDNVKNKESQLDVQGVFVAIGHIPNTNIFTDYLKLDKKGYFDKQQSTSESSIPGIFIAGDVADSRYKQAITSAASGCKAAIDVEKYLENIKN